jgi:mannan endo-1,4-beta-mannosidase
MEFRRRFIKVFALSLCLIVPSLYSVEDSDRPVTLNASPEAKALLKFLYGISGKYILTGQHNYPNTRDRNTQFAAKYIGKTPVVYSQDWGPARDGDTDSYLAQPDIVEEATRQLQISCSDLTYQFQGNIFQVIDVSKI